MKGPARATLRRYAPFIALAVVFSIYLPWASWRQATFVSNGPDHGLRRRLDPSNFHSMNEFSVAVHYTPQSIFEAEADIKEGDTTSPIELYEDTLRLGPAHSSINDIITYGRGRFVHRRGDYPGGEIRFSSSDNTDPMTNGRTYWLVHPNR